MYTIFGSSDQETAQEQLKMIVSAGRRVFEDLKGGRVPEEKRKK